MTEFQLGLLVVGALAVAGVIVYNKLQERGAQRRAERAFGSKHADVLLDGAPPRREPTLGPLPRTSEREADAATESLPDARLDYIVEITCGKPLAGTVFLEQWSALAHRFGRRALAACKAESGSWQAVAPGDHESHSRYRAALQLVSRAGVASETELIEFRTDVENVAARLGASVSAPEMRQALEAARETDRFCADADIQVVFHLIAPAGSAFDAKQIEAAASAAGLSPGLDGRRAARDAEGRLLYEMTAQDEGPTPRSLSLALDVPRVAEVDRVYQSMVRCARHIAERLGASIVDDNGRALDERSLMAIGGELEAVRRSMEERGLRPGGSLAVRLFA